MNALMIFSGEWISYQDSRVFIRQDVTHILSLWHMPACPSSSCHDLKQYKALTRSWAGASTMPLNCQPPESWTKNEPQPQVCFYSNKKQTKIPYDLNIAPRKMEIYVHSKTCTWIFKALFKTDKTEMSIHGWIYKQNGIQPYNGILLNRCGLGDVAQW
jgi:hypothetical protein